MSRVTTTTNEYLMAKVVDGILNSNVLATRLLSSPKKWKGTKIIKSVKTEKNTNGGSFSGFDTFSTNAVDNRVRLEFDPKFYEKGVTLPLTEISINQSDPSRIADLTEIELESATEDMADDIGTIFYGDGTGNGGKDFLGLEGIVDDGTNVATYGGQTRASYSTALNSTVTASGGTLTLAKMSALYNAVSSGSVRTTLGMTTEDIFSLYEQLLQPQERIVKDVPTMRGGVTAGTGVKGFSGLFYKGFPILADEKCTSGVMYFLNENFLEWRALTMAKTNAVKFKMNDIEGNDYDSVSGLGFSWSDWIIPTNQAAVISHMYLGGELWSKLPKRHGKLTGLTGV